MSKRKILTKDKCLFIGNEGKKKDLEKAVDKLFKVVDIKIEINPNPRLPKSPKDYYLIVRLLKKDILFDSSDDCQVKEIYSKNNRVKFVSYNSHGVSIKYNKYAFYISLLEGLENPYDEEYQNAKEELIK